MVSYKLNDQAKDDIKRIYRRGLAEYGEPQADAYYRCLLPPF